MLLTIMLVLARSVALICIVFVQLGRALFNHLKVGSLFQLRAKLEIFSKTMPAKEFRTGITLKTNVAQY
ncbi:hypothetical protein CK203_033290 [Vitis vinifera]|uniref:Uncharacterized protein n=1 Tax=Vitis vinifera TaxID=29760 RepID=A0A438HC13_VITVI|nr:hypothetical protein CK203_033290 [Vitis vinifera]